MYSKTITYNERPKMKRDAQLKAVFFPFGWASVFIFGCSLYVTALEGPRKLQKKAELHTV